MLAGLHLRILLFHLRSHLARLLSADRSLRAQVVQHLRIVVRSPYLVDKVKVIDGGIHLHLLCEVETVSASRMGSDDVEQEVVVSESDGWAKVVLEQVKGVQISITVSALKSQYTVC